MEEKLIELYCTICQCNDSRFLEGAQRQSNNNCPKFSDEELITVYLWGESTAVINAQGYLQLHPKPSFGVVSSAAQLPGFLQTAEPSYPGLPSIGGKLGGGGKERRYPLLCCGLLARHGCQAFLQHRRKSRSRVL